MRLTNILLFLFLFTAPQFMMASSEEYPSIHGQNLFFVIDMQEGFNTAQNRELQEKILKELLEAIDRGDFVFFFEYEGRGDTFSIFRDAVRGYSRVKILKKNMNSAASTWMTYLLNTREGMNTRVGNIRITGVNTEACIASTIRDLLQIASRFFNQIILLEEATGGLCEHYWNETYICEGCDGGFCIRSVKRAIDRLVREFISQQKFTVFSFAS